MQQLAYTQAERARLQNLIDAQASAISALQSAIGTPPVVPVPIGPASYYATGSTSSPLTMQLCFNNAGASNVHAFEQYSWTALAPCRVYGFSGRYPSGIPSGQTASVNIFTSDINSPIVTGNTINSVGSSAINYFQLVPDSAGVRLAAGDYLRLAQVRSAVTGTLVNICQFYVVWT